MIEESQQIAGMRTVIAAQMDAGTWVDIDECVKALYAAGYRKLRPNRGLYLLLSEDFVEPIVNFFIPDLESRKRAMELWRRADDAIRHYEGGKEE